MTARIFVSLLFYAALAGSCTLSEQEPPPLVGPSELSVSILVAATPDVLPTDGRAIAVLTVTVRDAYGIPIRNRSLRAEILQDGAPVDLGALAARNLLTDSSGRAATTYTAPAIHGDLDTGTTVDIGVTPVGTNAVNAVVRTTTIRLVPPLPVR